MNGLDETVGKTIISKDEEAQLIAEVLEGNTDQYQTLVQRYHRGLINYLYRIVYDQSLAEDLAQETFLQAYRKLHQYNSRYAFSTWLYKIASNLSYRHLKRHRHTVPIEELYGVSITDSLSEQAEKLDRQTESERVRKAVSTLEPRYQQVIQLYYWEDLSYEETAAVLNRPIGTVRTWLYRAKDQLRKDLYGQKH